MSKLNFITNKEQIQETENFKNLSPLLSSFIVKCLNNSNYDLINEDGYFYFYRTPYYDNSDISTFTENLIQDQFSEHDLNKFLKQEIEDMNNINFLQIKTISNYYLNSLIEEGLEDIDFDERNYLKEMIVSDLENFIEDYNLENDTNYSIEDDEIVDFLTDVDSFFYIDQDELYKNIKGLELDTTAILATQDEANSEFDNIFNTHYYPEHNPSYLFYIDTDQQEREKIWNNLDERKLNSMFFKLVSQTGFTKDDFLAKDISHFEKDQTQYTFREMLVNDLENLSCANIALSIKETFENITFYSSLRYLMENHSEKLIEDVKNSALCFEMPNFEIQDLVNGDGFNTNYVIPHPHAYIYISLKDVNYFSIKNLTHYGYNKEEIMGNYDADNYIKNLVVLDRDISNNLPFINNEKEVKDYFKNIQNHIVETYDLNKEDTFTQKEKEKNRTKFKI